MSENIYSDFFSELKRFIIELEIDKGKVVGCSDHEILLIEEKIGTTLPQSYKEYLRIMGRNFLFEFFDAEQMSFEDYDDINGYVNNTLKVTGFKFERAFFSISHRRYDYFRFFYLNESDNPKIWFFDEYPKDGKHTENSGMTFTQMILNFFSEILGNKTAGFHWVSEEDTKNNENIVRDRYLKWFEANLKLKDEIREMKTDNPFIRELYERFTVYFGSNNEKTAREQLKKYKNVSIKNDSGTTESENIYVDVKQNFWMKLKKLFS